MYLTANNHSLKFDNNGNQKSETRIITLNYGEKLDESVFRFQKGFIFFHLKKKFMEILKR